VCVCVWCVCVCVCVCAEQGLQATQEWDVVELLIAKT
jgi:hypothetical protein